MFALDPVRLIEHVHGHLGWLAAAALLHPAILLRRPARGAPLAVALATLAVTLAAAGGIALYPGYRAALQASLFASAPALGLLFERKEHLAFGAVILSWAGAASYFGAASAGPEAGPPLRRASHWAFVAATAFAVAAACFGTVVAAHATFGDSHASIERPE